MWKYLFGFSKKSAIQERVPVYSVHSNASEDFVYPDAFFQQSSKAMTERRASHVKPRSKMAPAKANPTPAKAATVNKPAPARLKTERIYEIYGAA